MHKLCRTSQIESGIMFETRAPNFRFCEPTYLTVIQLNQAYRTDCLRIYVVVMAAQVLE